MRSKWLKDARTGRNDAIRFGARCLRSVSARKRRACRRTLMLLSSTRRLTASHDRIDSFCTISPSFPIKSLHGSFFIYGVSLKCYQTMALHYPLTYRESTFLLSNILSRTDPIPNFERRFDVSRIEPRIAKNRDIGLDPQMGQIPCNLFIKQ